MTKSFSSHKVLENINLEIEQGKLTSLLGENGSGKSTLLNIIAGIELADVGGEVTYKERRLDEVNFPYTHDVFIAHEKINYILPITISEYINLLKRGIPKWNNNLFDQMVKDRKINLNENFLNFSRGQKMQVALMIGLASNASILLLDEITSVIDVYGRKYFLDLIGQHVKMGNTVVITTNIINELEYYTDNLIVLKNKKIVLNKSVSDIPLQFLKIRKKDNNTNHPIFSHKDCVWSGVNSDKSTSYIIPIDLCKEQEIPEEIKDRRKPSLEDIFIYFFNKNENKYEDIA